jgi:hypothetical protein
MRLLPWQVRPKKYHDHQHQRLKQSMKRARRITDDEPMGLRQDMLGGRLSAADN